MSPNKFNKKVTVLPFSMLRAPIDDSLLMSLYYSLSGTEAYDSVSLSILKGVGTYMFVELKVERAGVNIPLKPRINGVWGILEHFGPVLKSRWVLGRQRGSRLPGTLEPGQLLPITLAWK